MQINYLLAALYGRKKQKVVGLRQEILDWSKFFRGWVLKNAAELFRPY